MRFIDEDVDYWIEVLEGGREPDPSCGMDMEELCLMLLQEVKALKMEITKFQNGQGKEAMDELVPGIPRRPGLDALFQHVEALVSVTCGICGKQDPMLRWNGCVVLTGDRLSPWMCMNCKKDWDNGEIPH
jgi:hypothetical protein